VSSGAVAPSSLGPVRRALDWFWRGRELRQLQQERKAESPRKRQLVARAELLFQLAERTWRPTERLPHPADAVAAELYRQSAYFAVRAVTDSTAVDVTSPWEQLGQPLIQRLGDSGDSGATLSRLVEDGDFTEPWELPKEQQALRATELAGVARTLLDELSWQTRARDALWIQRLLRIGMLVALLLSIIGGVRYLMDRSEQARNLAAAKPWRASSSTGAGCSSPLQQCADSADFFFHTQEERQPWLEIDLGKPTRFTAVRVDNRRDCCFDRAKPLVIEAGNDQEHFKELARRTTSFGSWFAQVPPTEARYVRVRSPSKTILHLAEVRVLR
jgi:hypothetical protein